MGDTGISFLVIKKRPTVALFAFYVTLFTHATLKGVSVFIRIVLFFFLFTYSVFASANNTPFKNFSIDNPLAYRAVSSIVQDKHGFLWFGSSEGVYRYDGYQFTRFYYDPNIDNSLSSNVVSQLLLDAKGRLWVATRGGGLNLLQDDSETFTTFNQSSAIAPINNDFINKLAQDKLGKLWVGTEDGLTIISESNGEWVTQPITFDKSKKGLNGKVIESILMLNDKTVWVGTNGGGLTALAAAHHRLAFAWGCSINV